MKKTVVLLSMLLAILMFCQSAYAVSTGSISTTDKYAWAETSGWVNFRPDNAGVMVYPDHLEGYAWAENIGCVKLGSYSGGGSHTYGNGTKDDWGVNLSANGNLSGFGWSETSGWVNFGTANGNMHFDKITGPLTGYAWAENAGWIHFDHAVSPVYGVKTIQHTISSYQGTGGGITCDAGAPEGWTVTCTINTQPDYYIVALTDTGSIITTFPDNTYPIVGITSDHTISAATFAEYMVQRIDSIGPNYEKSLAEAYSNVKELWERILLKYNGTYSSMNITQPKKIILEGGYGIGFSRVPGEASAISGSMTVTDGAVATDRIIIQQ